MARARGMAVADPNAPGNEDGDTFSAHNESTAAQEAEAANRSDFTVDQESKEAFDTTDFPGGKYYVRRGKNLVAVNARGKAIDEDTGEILNPDDDSQDHLG